MPSEAALLDKQAVAHAFSRAAPRYDRVASLQRDVFQSLLEPVLATRSPQRLVDLGCGTGVLTQRIAQSQPGAQIVGVDFAAGMLQFAAQHDTQDRIFWVCGDAERLPLAAQSVDAVVSNFALQWCEQFGELFADLYRVLSPGGCLLFTLPGQGTLQELAASWRAADPGHQHVNQFPALQTLKVALMQAGFSTVSLRLQRFQTQYSTVRDLLNELKTLGAHNVNQGRARQLTGKQRLRDLLAAYEGFRLPTGELPASWHVIVGECSK